MEKIALWLADIRQLRDREGEALPLLTPERGAQAQRIRPERERLQCIAAGLLLRRVLGVRREEDLHRNEFGKPLLAKGGPHFNLSHGGDYAILALFREPVGADIEPIGERPRVRLPRRLLLPEELAWLEAENTPERFAWLWTRLESALKADGRGLSMEGRTFSVLTGGEPWWLESIRLDGHVVSCAAPVPFEIQPERMAVEDLLV